MEAGFQKDQTLLRSLELSFLSYPSPIPHRPTSEEGKSAGDWLNNQSCLWDETSIKTRKQWSTESIWVGKHIHMLGGWHTPIPWGKKLLCLGPIQTLPYVPPHPAVHFYFSCQILADIQAPNSVPMVYVSAFRPVPYCFHYYCFVIYFEIRNSDISCFVLLIEDCFGCWLLCHNLYERKCDSNEQDYMYFHPVFSNRTSRDGFQILINIWFIDKYWFSILINIDKDYVTILFIVAVICNSQNRNKVCIQRRLAA